MICIENNYKEPYYTSGLPMLDPLISIRNKNSIAHIPSFKLTMQEYHKIILIEILVV